MKVERTKILAVILALIIAFFLVNCVKRGKRLTCNLEEFKNGDESFRRCTVTNGIFMPQIDDVEEETWMHRNSVKELVFDGKKSLREIPSNMAQIFPIVERMLIKDTRLMNLENVNKFQKLKTFHAINNSIEVIFKSNIGNISKVYVVDDNLQYIEPEISSEKFQFEGSCVQFGGNGTECGSPERIEIIINILQWQRDLFIIALVVFILIIMLGMIHLCLILLRCIVKACKKAMEEYNERLMAQKNEAILPA